MWCLQDNLSSVTRIFWGMNWLMNGFVLMGAATGRKQNQEQGDSFARCGKSPCWILRGCTGQILVGWLHDSKYSQSPRPFRPVAATWPWQMHFWWPCRGEKLLRCAELKGWFYAGLVGPGPTKKWKFVPFLRTKGKSCYSAPCGCFWVPWVLFRVSHHVLRVSCSYVMYYISNLFVFESRTSTARRWPDCNSCWSHLQKPRKIQKLKCYTDEPRPSTQPPDSCQWYDSPWSILQKHSKMIPLQSGWPTLVPCRTYMHLPLVAEVHRLMSKGQEAVLNQ